MNDIVSELGNKIRILRTNLSISQEELAFKSGISPAHLGQIERGLKSPTITTVKKLLMHLMYLLQIYLPLIT